MGISIHDLIDFQGDIEDATRVICYSEEDAEKFLSMCDEYGVRWASGDSLIGKTNWGKRNKDGYLGYVIRYCSMYYSEVALKRNHIDFSEIEEFREEIQLPDLSSLF